MKKLWSIPWQRGRRALLTALTVLGMLVQLSPISVVATIDRPVLSRQLASPKYTEYEDPLYRYRLMIPETWHASPTPENALYGAAVFYNYDPDLAEAAGKVPVNAIKIQIGVAPLLDQQDFRNWTMKWMTFEVNNDAVRDDGLSIRGSIQSIKIGDFHGITYIVDQPQRSPVMEIDLMLNNTQVMVIGLSPANSPAIDDALAMLATVQPNDSLVFSQEVIDIATQLDKEFMPFSFPQATINVTTNTCPAGTFPGTEAPSTPILLYMPFRAGESWTVGGAGSFYGNNYHCNSYNDYYATDWNRPNDEGAAVLPVADGTISGSQAPTCPASGYGCYVQINHASNIRTLYGHLSGVYRTTGSVSHTDQIGTVGNTGNSEGAHLHLQFRQNGFSHCYNNGNTCPNGEAPLSPQSPKPSPMNTINGLVNLVDGSSYTSNNGDNTPPPPSCPTSGGVILYKHANYNCGGEGASNGYFQRTTTGWQNVPSSFNDQASSIRVPSGWSVKLYQQSDRGGGWACRTSNDSDFWGDQFSNGVGLNDQVSSFEVFNSPNCGENHSPNTPTLESPPDNHSTQDGRAPTLCWNNAGDPDGDPVQFYAEVYDSPMTTNSGWTSNTCWRPSSLDGHYHTYKWRVRARDNAGSQSEWSNTRRFTIQAPNQPPTIAFNTANGNSASLIESREQNWTFQGTSSDPDGSVNRVELRCSGDNCGSGASQANGTTSWSLARSAMAGRNEVYFQVYDNQGASATSRHLDLRIDLAAPTTGNNLIGTAGNNDWYISPVEVHLHADDGSTGGVRVGVDRVVYRLDGGTWQNRSGSDVSLVINSDGTHTVDYYAVDKVGNTESQKQVTFKIDATPPSAPGTATEIHGVLSGQWQKGLDDPSFIWVAATDTASGIWYYRVNWNNTLQVTQGTAYDPPAVRTGSYELSVQAVDQAGNVGSVGAAFTFRYDGTPPPAPAIQNHDGIASGVWQNSIRTPNFSWPTPTDQGSGVAGYNRYWGPDANGESSTLVTDNTFVSATPICAADEAAIYYLRLRTQDGVGWQSEWVGYALAYDGAPPTGTLIANYGLPVAHQTSVHLDIAASDAGSGVAQMRLSNSGYNWSDWMSPASELYWEIPALGRREHAIYLQLVDGAGNVSDIISDTVYFDVNVPFPKSENFHMWDSLLAAGGGIITSTHLIQRATVGQPSESVALQSAQYLLNPGFQAGALAAPIRVPTYTTHLQLGSLMASATTSATAIASGHYRLYGSLGQPSDMRTVTSTHFTASLGFWGGAARDVTPQPPEPPAPPAPPECEFYSLSINDGALFTRSPLVTLDLCGPDPVQMMLSNDGGFNGTTWQPYTPTISWTLTTYGNYVLPRLVYVRYRDGSNVIHGNFFDDIIYDPNAPEGAVAFDAAALLPGMKLQAASQPLRVTSTPDTELFLSFADDSSGMAEIQISLTPDFADATWQPYAGIVPVTFTEEGVQTVYVRTRDQAGNTSAVVTDTLMVDTIPPLGSIYPIEVVGPNTLSLTMLLAAWDNVSDVSDVRISTVGSLENALWQPYVPEITVPISYTGIAQPLIYAQFRDAAGNVSAIYTTTYLVDTTPPVLYVEVAPGDTLTRTLNILVYDELSRIGEMRLSNDPLFLEGVVTLPYTQTVTWAFDTRRVVWVQIADSVGNFSEPFPAYAHEGAAIPESKVYLPLVLRQQ